MTREELMQRTDAAISAAGAALQLLWDSIVKGQQTQLIKRDEIKEILGRYGVKYDGRT